MASHISQEILFGLPEDSDLAFAQLEAAARERLEGIFSYAEAQRENPGDECEFDYMGDVLAAAEELGIEELSGWKLPDREDEYALRACRNFRQDAKRVALKLSIRGVRRAQGYSVVFDAATKIKLRHHLEEIRRMVDKLEISQAKRDRFYSCIDSFDLEIGKDRTKIDTYGALVMEAATHADNASKPLSDAIWRLGAALGFAKASAREQGRLPPPTKPKQLEAPKAEPVAKAKPVAKSFEKDLDDEIPF